MTVGPAGGDVLVVGDLMVDVVVTYRDPIAVGSDTAAEVRRHGGGSAANTAAWLADGGTPVRLLAAVGGDVDGVVAVDQLTAVGVTWAGATIADAATGTCVVLVGPDGERTMFPDRGANAHLDGVDVDAACSPRPAWVHLSGYALLGVGAHEAARATLAAARQLGIPVSVDAASAAPLREVGADRFRSWIDGCTVLFANDDELDALGGLAAVGRVAAEVVAKHGADGSSWTDGTTRVDRAAPAVTVVDTTGAGDAFAAGWIAARLAGADPHGALDGGSATAERAVRRRGGRPGR